MPEFMLVVSGDGVQYLDVGLIDDGHPHLNGGYKWWYTPTPRCLNFKRSPHLNVYCLDVSSAKMTPHLNVGCKWQW